MKLMPFAGHVSALRSRWEQEASRGQSAFKTSHPTTDEHGGSTGSLSYTSGDLEIDTTEVCSSGAISADRTGLNNNNTRTTVQGLGENTDNNAPTTMIKATMGTDCADGGFKGRGGGTDGTLTPQLSYLLDDLRNRVNPNGYVDSTTYQYRVSSVSSTPSSSRSKE